jgi:hypothetical protein
LPSFVMEVVITLLHNDRVVHDHTSNHHLIHGSEHNMF